MIAQVRGILVHKTSTEAVVECSGVGYLLFISVNTAERLPSAGEEVKLLTLLIPREDALQLFGFYNEAERDGFRLLIGIGGIGPKTAIGILSSVTLDELQNFVLTNNLFALQKLPGIGKKTAERMIIELRDKIGKVQIPDGEREQAGGVAIHIQQEALAALVSLGYNRALAEKALKRVVKEDKPENATAELLIKKALRYTMQ